MQNWKTTLCGLVAGIALALGNYNGPNTWHGYLAAVALAAIGILAKDFNVTLSPGDVSAIGKATGITGSTAKLGAWMLIAVLLMGTMTACSGVTVAQDIVNWTPALQSAVGVVDTTASVLDPAAAPIFTAATVGFDAASNLLVAQAKTYLANPNAGALQQLQAQVVSFQQNVNAALLAAVKIVNPASQQKALADLNAVATVVNAILALVLSVSSKAAAATMAAAARIKIAAVEPYINKTQAAWTLAAHYKDAAGFPEAMTSGTFGAGSVALNAGIVDLQQDGF